MGEPFRAFFVPRFVGHCDSCGLASKGSGIRSGRATTICARCAEAIAGVVNERAVSVTTTETTSTQAVVPHVEADGVAWPMPEPPAAPEQSAPAEAVTEPTKTKRRRKA